MISAESIGKLLYNIKLNRNILVEIDKEAKESETIRNVVSNFIEFLSTCDARLSLEDRSRISEAIGSHLILFERLAREDEREKCKTLKGIINEVEKRKMNKNNFKNSILMLATEYVRGKNEKMVLNRILKRIK